MTMATANLQIDLSQKTTVDVQYKIAATRAERSAAFRLVYQSYLEAGLGGPNPSGMHVTPYHLLPTTQVFIATIEEVVIFTMTLVADGELGLPMESVYVAEVAERREQGLSLGEVSCLADRRSQFRGFFPVFLRLSRLMVQYARKQSLDELLIAAHPKHARFYRRYMDFHVIGEETVYPTVRNRPAVALSLNFARVDRYRPENYDTFFGEAIPEERLEPQPLPWEDYEYFRQIIDPGFTLAPIGPAEDTSRSSRLEPTLSMA